MPASVYRQDAYTHAIILAIHAPGFLHREVALPYPGKAAADGHAPVQIDLNPTGGAATPAAQWTHLAYRILLDELTWSIGDVLEVSWAFGDGAGGGVRDEIAFDDIALRAVYSAHSVAEPPLLGMILVACGIAAGLRTRRRVHSGCGARGVIR